MKYVCIDDGAVAEIISGREYQSIDFEEGNKLIQALAGRLQFMAKMGKVILFQDKEGAFLTTPGPWKKKRFLVIDCEQSSLFTQLRTNESLITFQKLLRFCAKYWTGGQLNKSEKLISRTSKAIIFPLPYKASDPFRIAIERSPLDERLKKRDLDGRFLLVYKSGHDSANSATEEANETTFRRVVDRLPEVYNTVEQQVASIEGQRDADQLASTELITPGIARPAHLPYREWIPLLTEQQKKFIFSNTETPHRLQGPAGTGKTLSLTLRTLCILMDAERRKRSCQALLVTHSEATRDAIKEALLVIDPIGFQLRDRKTDAVCLSVQTLASLCANQLSQAISETEFVDRDAQDSKLLQQMYVEQALSQTRDADFHSFRPHLSESFRAVIDDEGNPALASLFQHEISILIKGRAGDSFDAYKKCPSLKYGLPAENDADKGYAFQVFKRYQRQLETSSQFDTDDVVISAVGQLDTPIWRRRRAREGFDFIAIDETHLFNINELHVFHHFTREVGSYPISFTVDQAQAVGDRGWNDISGFSSLFGTGEAEEADQTDFSAVFRSSPAIREFCHSVLASGATLFTNFVNTMNAAQSAFTVEDERRAQEVEFLSFSDDQQMIEGAFKRADELQGLTESTRPQILITSLSDGLIKRMKDFAESSNKPVTFLERRGDYGQVRRAEKSGHLVLGHADYVGGLEFNAVVVVGVDKGRVPFEGETEDSNSRSYASYVAHNRLYVASSRAKYALSLLGLRSRGASDLLKSASRNGLISGVE